MTHDPKAPHGGPAITRRRAMTVMGVAAGLPWVGVADRPDIAPDTAPLLYQWNGTSLGSPSHLLLYHHPFIEDGVFDAGIADVNAEVHGVKLRRKPLQKLNFITFASLKR